MIIKLCWKVCAWCQNFILHQGGGVKSRKLESMCVGCRKKYAKFVKILLTPYPTPPRLINNDRSLICCHSDNLASVNTVLFEADTIDVLKVFRNVLKISQTLQNINTELLGVI